MRIAKAGLILATLCSAFIAKADTLVAEPARADRAQWPHIQYMDRDFWYLLTDRWSSLKGVNQEPFVEEAGLWSVRWPMKRWNYSPQRVLRLRELRLQDTDGKPINFSVKVEPVDGGTEIYNAENLTDGSDASFCSISGSIATPQVRYKPVQVKLSIQVKNPTSLKQAILSYGDNNNPDLGESRFFIDGRKIEPLSQQNDREKRLLTVSFADQLILENITIFCESAPLKIELEDFPEELSKKLLKRPFSLLAPRPLPFGLSPDNFYHDKAERLLTKYDKSNIGFYFGEWDSQGFFQSSLPNNTMYREFSNAFGETPRDRYESEESLHRFWDWNKSLYFNRVWGMSGAVGYPQYGMEWGGNVAGMELTNHTSTIPHRTLLRYTAGAGRQYNKPWLLYLAYYLGRFSPRSTVPMPDKDSTRWVEGPDVGISPSFARRVFMTSYFMGMNFLSFEAQPYGFVDEQSNGQTSLNTNGRVLKDFYEWSRSAAGKRGEWYTPILLAVDYHHGMFRQDGNIWGYNIPPEKGDLMGAHINRAIDYYDGQRQAWDKPPYSHNLHNSPLGDIFNTEFANPPSGAYPKFDNYAVTMLTDEVKISSELGERLKNYVLNGGTLVFNSIHLKSLPQSMMPIRLTGKTSKDEGMTFPEVVLHKNCEVVMKMASGRPFAVKYRYGNGNAILTIPEYLLGEDREQPVPYVGQLLEKLQSEVLPFQISGDAQFLVSRLSEGHWKVALINNKGVLKQPWEREEKFDSSYATAVTLTLPRNSSVKEIFGNVHVQRTGETVQIDLPPGEIRVLEIQDAKVASQENALPLLGEWKLDGTPGKTNGESRERTYDMKYVKTPSGRTVYSATEPETAVLVDYNPGFPLNFGTIEFWAAPDLTYSFSDRGGYPIAGNKFWVFLNNKRWGFNAFDSDVVNGPEAKQDKWTHIAFAWDGKVIRFFVDGTEYTNGGVPLKTILPIWDNHLEIGTRRRGVRTFGGKIADVKLYSKMLPPENIQKLYHEGKDRF